MQEHEFKSICGKLIGYYRKTLYQETKAFQYTVRGMVEKSGGEPIPIKQKSICSSTTLRQLENGCAKKNEDLYFCLAAKVHKQYHYSRKHLSKLFCMILAVYHVVEKMELAEMKRILKELEHFPFPNCLYYAENIRVLCHFLSYYLYQNLPSEEEICRLLNIAELLPPLCKKMVIHLFGEYYRRINYQPAKIIAYFEHLSFSSVDYLTLYTLIPLCITMQQFFLAHQLLVHLKKTNDFNRNTYKQFYYYNIKSCIQANVDFKTASISLNQCLSIIDDTRHLTVFQRAAVYHNLGILYFFEKQYQKAVHYMILAAKHNPKIILPMLPYLFQSVQHSQKDFSLMIQALQIYQKASLKPQGLFFHYYHYFTLRCRPNPLSKKEAKMLERRITEAILPALKISDQSSYSSDLREFFIHELRQLNRLTKSHSIVQKI